MKNLKELRSDNDLTLEKAAEKLDVSVNTLVKWENSLDLSTIKVSSAIKIMELYGVDINFFIQK